jgi:hypothetical protein
MMHDVYEAIDAFTDGERVEPDRLDRALADPAGRAYLIDLLVLRGLLSEPQVMSIAAPAAASPARRRVTGLFAIAASALLLVASGLGGFVAGHRVAATFAQPAAPPAPERIVLPDTQISAPAPTRVIQVEPGVDWKLSAGGN